MRTLLLVALLSVAAPALANHPAERLDEVLAEREPAFEAIDGISPDLSLEAADGREFDLHGQTEKIFVLSFVPEDCGAPCAAQQQLLTEVQSGNNVTPMRELVSFVTVAAPGTPVDSAWAAENWQGVVPGGEMTTAKLAAELADGSQRAEEAPMVHILDRGARRAAIFHGAEFGPVNMVLYINGLSNAPPPEPGFVERLSRWLP